MSEAQFDSKCNEIVTLFRKLKLHFWQKGTLYVVNITNVHTIKKKPFVTKINLTGNDHFGYWKSQGYIVCEDSGIKFWMYKEYFDKAAAGQIDQW